VESSSRGKSSPEYEITNISEHGFWILLRGTEYLLPFEKFPWFREAKVAEITNVKLYHEGN